MYNNSTLECLEKTIKNKKRKEMINMTIKEVKEMYKDEYADVETYETNEVGEHYPTHFHTDNCRATEYYIEESSEVGLYELMDEEEYNNSILANTSERADFAEWYGDKEAKVLCIMLKNE